jgi:MoaA/NifB/PqqE/SkfB family radical SAM enzyme
MDELISRLKSWEKGMPSYPTKIEFWPTNRCNLRCKYCRSSDLRNDCSLELSDDRILELVDESSNLGVKEWVIAGGGEPLVRKKVVKEVMQKIKHYEMYGALTTNGTLLDKDVIKQIVEINWDVVFFSIDGYDPKTNDFLRKKGVFKKVYGSLKLFKKLKHNSSSKPLIGFSSVLTNTNYNHIKELILLAYDVGCEHVIINPIKGNNTGYNEKLKLNKTQIEELRAQIPELIRLSEDLKIKTTLPTLNTDLVEKSSGINNEHSKKIEPIKNSFKHVKCYEPWTSMLINPEGGVGPCCERPEDSLSANIKYTSLKEVWQGKHFQEIRKDILNGVLNNRCFICNAWKLTDTESIKKDLRTLDLQVIP